MQRTVRKKLTRKDKPSVSLENFALMANDMIVWNDNERVLAIDSACKYWKQAKGVSTYLLVPGD